MTPPAPLPVMIVSPDPFSRCLMACLSERYSRVSIVFEGGTSAAKRHLAAFEGPPPLVIACRHAAAELQALFPYGDRGKLCVTAAAEALTASQMAAIGRRIARAAGAFDAAGKNSTTEEALP